MKTYIAYLRQSTSKQEQSGLGVEAQREIIHRHLKGATIISEFVETETGKRNDRPKLMEALAQCRKTGSILVCAKLDRLSRNVAFTSRLLESDVEILFCDFPEANRLILHIISSIAEYEANLISIRTRQSLQAKKSRGCKLGKSENLMNRHVEAIQNSNRTNSKKAIDNDNNKRASALIKAMVNDNKSFAEITKSLNSQGFKTSRGCQFQIVQVQRIYEKYCI
ncbi:DNA invertase Pin-like site-specific DNA recombinase [Dysgonomonadaceae bacterium PH5-43]|nr:DNA invertase Pin-like site-specific DNA recombinase [Dysgonomonadaceae bacterium PH5-43]